MAQEPLKNNERVEPAGYSTGRPDLEAVENEPPAGQEPGEQAAPNFMLFGFGAVLVLVLAVVAMLLITRGDIAETPAPASLSGQAAEGKRLFLANNCESCHPAEGRAGGTGPRLSTTSLGDEAVKNITRRGKGAMPGNGRLTNEQLDQLVAYIRAIKPPPSSK